ncbi:hypothetical protein E2C01_062905 [Portunus trituberculatus]|uniref:Uncharacterized protein n=1 Tax=Portunus trituberculatus TaxID=210409 RepID=A0A5B7H7S9_PORTR|nr:hypothetical protein [Portunus trituberculatus]
MASSHVVRLQSEQQSKSTLLFPAEPDVVKPPVEPEPEPGFLPPPVIVRPLGAAAHFSRSSCLCL